jgi:hypothetical protein
MVDEKTYQEAKALNDKVAGERTIYKMIETLASSDAAVAKHLGKAVYTVDEVKTIDTQDQDLLKVKLQCYKC